MTLAGCQFVSNHAKENGGGIYVSTNQTLTVLDSWAYKQLAIVETDHPYQSKPPIGNASQVIISRSVSVSEADGLMLIFDFRTNVNNNDNLYIYTDSSRKQRLFTFSGNVGWPGVNSPALFYQLNSLYIELRGPEINYLNSSYYGFKLTVYPFGVKLFYLYV